MSTSLRTRHAARGFSMVELLVTIIIAGIVFAAMVPLFTTILGKNAEDNLRNIAAFLAQDKMERLRQLDFMETTNANLANPAFKPDQAGNGQFGPWVDYRTSAGTKRFYVKYEVTLEPSAAGHRDEQYKQVLVEVYWDQDHKHFYQITRIYRQWAGPSVSLDIAPTPDADGAIFDPTQIVLTATVPEAWRGSSGLPGYEVPLTSKVLFSIWLVRPDGRVFQADQVVPTTGTTGQYQWTWPVPPTASLGLYLFTAKAYDSTPLPDEPIGGEEAGLYASLESHTPDPPTGLQAFPGVKQVLLTWDPCPHPRFDHFEIWRSTTAGQPGDMIATTTDNESPTYLDTGPEPGPDPGLTSGKEYVYSLKAVAKWGTTSYASLACPQVSATPLWPLTDDTTPPSKPALTVKKVDKQSTITLTWSASVDPTPPAPPSGLDHYWIYRSANGSTWPTSPFTQLAKTETSWADTSAGWNTTWYYKIEAYDLAGNFSTSTPDNPYPSATTDAAPTYALTVTNANKRKDAYVWVKEMVSGLYYSYTTPGATSTTPPAGTKVAKNNKTAFASLPPGLYNVYANFNGQTYVSAPYFWATGSGPYVCTVQ